MEKVLEVAKKSGSHVSNPLLVVNSLWGEVMLSFSFIPSKEEGATLIRSLDYDLQV